MIASSLRELAVDFYRQALEWFERAGDRLGIARCLEGVAALAAHRGQAEQAGRLFGAAEALLEQTGLAPWPGWFPAHLRPERLAPARAATEDNLGPEAFRHAAAAGARLSLHLAVAEALGALAAEAVPQRAHRRHLRPAHPGQTRIHLPRPDRHLGRPAGDQTPGLSSPSRHHEIPKILNSRDAARPRPS